MPNVVNIPGYGDFDFGDISDDQIEKDLGDILKGAPSPAEIEKRLTGVMQARTRPAPPAPVATGAPGPINNKGEEVDAEGNPIDAPYVRSERPFRARAEDVLTRMADSLSWGTAPKLSAKIGEWQGEGTYDENLAKRRAGVEAAGERLGPGGALAADIAGGLLSGSALARIPALWGSAAPGVSLLSRAGPRTGLLTKTGAGAIEGGAYGAANAAGHTDGQIDDYATNAIKGAKEGALWGGGTAFGLGALGKAITPFPADSARRTLLATTLRQEGVPVSAGEATGNEGLRRAEVQLGKTPGSQLFFERPTANDMERATQQAMQRAGIGGADRATPEVIDEGFNRVGGTIGRIQSSTPVHLDNQTLTDAVGIMNHAQDSLTQPGEIAIVNRFVDRLTSAQHLSSDAASALRTDLNEAIKSARSNPGLRDHLIDVKNALDGSLERTLLNAGNHADHAALVEARRHYANLHVLSDAIDRSGSAGDNGVVTPSALANAVSNSVGRTSAVRGRGDLNELGKAVRGIKVGPSDSGTSANWGALDPARIALGAATAPFVFNPVSQRYLANQVLPRGIPGGVVQGAVAGTAAGPADRIMQGLLGP